jgi:S-DNA-T family DNA segregation ATPase FtsK/SpoIIIE
MRTRRSGQAPGRVLWDVILGFLARKLSEGVGLCLLLLALALGAALATWSIRDPSINHAIDGPVRNLVGWPGAVASDLLMQLFGIATLALLLPLAMWGWRLLARRPAGRWGLRLLLWSVGVAAAAGVAAGLPRTDHWPLPSGLGGAIGDAVLALPLWLAAAVTGVAAPVGGAAKVLAVLAYAALAIAALTIATGELTQPERDALDDADEEDERRRFDDEPGAAIVSLGAMIHGVLSARAALRRRFRQFREGGFAADARSFVHSVTRVEEPGLAAVGAGRREPVLVSQPRAPQTSGRITLPVEPREEAVWRETAAPARPAAPPVASPAPAPEPAEPAPQPPPAAAQRPVPTAKWFRGTLRGFTRGSALVEPAVTLAEAAAGPIIRRLEPVLAAAPEPEPAPAPPAPRSRVVKEPPAPAPAQAQPEAFDDDDDDEVLNESFGSHTAPIAPPRVAPPPAPIRLGKREVREAQSSFLEQDHYQFPPVALLSEPKRATGPAISEDALEQNARLLEGVLEDFGVRGEIINVRPGPVVTLYELEPAPGTKSSRVIGLADDIARSMSAISARVAVVPGRNAIGIELPNTRRETVYFRELISSVDFEKTKLKLALCLGKTIGGEGVIVELAKMPHLLVAGTTGSGKSVAINTMVLSLLYRLKPEECRLIMIDPKMVELSVYEGIPHLLTPVVTDPKKAVVALKWAVREMEDRYRKLSKVGVRNIDGFNARVLEAKAKGEVITREVQKGFDRETGEIIMATEEMELEPLHYIVVIIDEMADLMMVAGKEIEGAVQRLAQMARAVGIHVIMATQRPSVDVITGIIKANFPTRISFQVTSKIDSRTILGEMGAEQLLGQGDMLYMPGAGRITRVHGPFVSDLEVEKVVAHLKSQGRPQYLEDVTAEEGEDGEPASDGAVFDKGAFGAEDGADLYEQAIQVVLRDKKASTSYIQRRLQIGYNRAASLMERMEREGVVGPANHAGKREILRETEEA